MTKTFRVKRDNVCDQQRSYKVVITDGWASVNHHFAPPFGKILCWIFFQASDMQIQVKHLQKGPTSQNCQVDEVFLVWPDVCSKVLTRFSVGFPSPKYPGDESQLGNQNSDFTGRMMKCGFHPPLFSNMTMENHHVLRVDTS